MSRMCVRRNSDGKEFEVIRQLQDGSVVVEDNGKEVAIAPNEFTVVPCPGDEPDTPGIEM